MSRRPSTPPIPRPFMLTSEHVSVRSGSILGDTTKADFELTVEGVDYEIIDDPSAELGLDHRLQSQGHARTDRRRALVPPPPAIAYPRSA